MILNRLKNTNRPRNKHYQNVKMLIDKETFVSWFMANDFEGASVDRIDNTKDYSLDNIQMIPMSFNRVKDKNRAKDGMCKCYRCKETKPIEMFATDNRRKNGHSTICKKCDSIRDAERRIARYEEEKRCTRIS
jgi:hypothetical protein